MVMVGTSSPLTSMVPVRDSFDEFAFAVTVMELLLEPEAGVTLHHSGQVTVHVVLLVMVKVLVLP
jgi:hypothetical protein